MAEVRLRKAEAGDEAAIRDLIHRVQINPNGLDWHRFLLAVNEEDGMIGCVQLKPHGGEVMELASLAVEPAYRLRGIGRLLIEETLNTGPRPLYLMCRAELGPLYEKFGFEKLQVKEMPTYFRRIKRLFSAYERLNRGHEVLLVMKLK